MICSRLFDFIYKKSEITSVDQLLEDFGEYPPTPLCCKTPPDAKVYKVVGNGLGYLIYKNKQLIWTMNNVSNLADFGNKKLNEPAEVISLAWNQLSKAKSELVESIKESNILLKFVYLILSPVAFSLALLMLILVSIYALKSIIILNVNAYKRFNERLGEHVPIGNGESFYVFIKKSKGNEDAIVSHECLHVLQDYQNFDGEEVNRNLDVEANLKGNVEDKYLDNSTVKYFFNRLEIEARLHEVVLMHYRSKKLMPLDVSEFRVMLINDFLEVTDKSNENSVSGSEDRSRSNELRKELFHLEYYLKEGITLEVIFAEMLAPMYANLLMYYGDLEASEAFRSKIESDELYQELYGDGFICHDKTAPANGG